MILPKIRDSRFITIRHGGTLTDYTHHLLAAWSAKCAGHVLHYFESECPEDDRPRKAIEKAYAWAKSEIKVTESKTAAYHSNAAARGITGSAKFAALSAGQAAAVAHVAAHDLGAAAYAIRAVIEGSDEGTKIQNGINECRWQREQLPEELKELVISDQNNRNAICWNVFTD